MIIVAVLSIALLFSTFVFLDLISVLPRVAGSIVGKHGIGYSFQVIVNTVKRVFIVLYPPIMGLIAIYGTLSDLFLAIFVSYGTAMLAVITSLLLRNRAIAYFCATIDIYARGSGLLPGLYMGMRTAGNWKKEVDAVMATEEAGIQAFTRNDPRILFAALWIFFFYSASIFVINILGFIFQDYSSAILQMTGLANAIGTIALAFYLDPKLSRIYENNSNILVAVNSLMFAHVLNICALSPIFFAALFFSLG